MVITSIFKQNRYFMLGAPSSIVNNKNADVEVRTHDEITLSLDFFINQDVKWYIFMSPFVTSLR